MHAQRDALATEVKQLRAQLERDAAQAEARLAAALDRQEKELTGSMEERLAMKEEQERSARVELLQRQIARRFLHSDLTAGWNAWVEVWQARSERRRMLQRVADSIVRPGVASA